MENNYVIVYGSDEVLHWYNSKSDLAPQGIVGFFCQEGKAQAPICSYPNKYEADAALTHMMDNSKRILAGENGCKEAPLFSWNDYELLKLARIKKRNFTVRYSDPE